MRHLALLFVIASLLLATLPAQAAPSDICFQQVPDCISGRFAQYWRDNGGLTRANGDRYRATVLSVGGTRDYYEVFRSFTGREPRIEPMLEARGLLGTGRQEPSSNSD